MKAQGLCVNYGDRAVLRDITCDIPRGKMVGIIGPNGAGKTTLLKACLGLIDPIAGEITLSAERSQIAYVPQRGTVDWDFPITALEVVLMGRTCKWGPFGRPRKADREAAQQALEQVGLGPFADRQIGEFSGGQQQRLFLARALMQEAELFLLDEPFAGVDLATEREIVQLLHALRAEGKSIFVVHHDLPTVENYFDWAILLNTRLVAAGPVADVFTPEHLARAFGRSQSLFDEAAALSAKRISGLI